MNHGQLRGFVGRQLARNDANVTTVITDYLNQAVSKITQMRDIMLLRREVDVTVVGGNPTLNIFTAVPNLQYLRRIGARDAQGTLFWLYHALTEEEGAIRAAAAVEGASATAVAFYLLGDDVKLFPTPVSDQTLAVEYQTGFPAMVNDADENVLMRQFPLLIAYRALADLVELFWSVQWAQLWEQRYAQELLRFLDYDAAFSITSTPHYVPGPKSTTWD